MDIRRASSRAQQIISWTIIAGVIGLLVYGVSVVARDTLRHRPLLTIGKATLRVDLATTASQQEKGLGGRTDIAKDQAMLFVFDHDDNWGIWMKGMKMPIDVVWLDSDKKVVHIVENMPLDAEPYNTYKPPVPARYVLEMKSGIAGESGVKVGSQASFDLETGV